MENKKEIIIKVLTKLKPYRNLAEEILALVESNYVDEKMIEWLLKIIDTALKKTNKDNERKKLIQAQAIIQKIKMKEKNEWEDADVYLEEMLDKL